MSAKKWRLVLVLLVGSSLYVQAFSETRTAPPMCPSTELAALDQQWSAWVVAYQARNLKATMDIFDPDVIFSFQGSADQGYSDLERAYKADFDAGGAKREWVPQFEESECAGRLGFVRSTWVLRQTNESGKTDEFSEESWH
jgi:ketosteroid isomerase-like protein